MGQNLADILNSIEDEEDELPAKEDEDVFIDPEQAVVTKVKRWAIVVFFCDYFQLVFISPITFFVVLT